MTTVGYILVIILVLVWLVAVGGTITHALGQLVNDEYSRAFIEGFIAILLIAIPLGFGLSASGHEHANQLCLAGHEEWRTTTTSILAGKVIVPITSRSKVWICERWEP